MNSQTVEQPVLELEQLPLAEKVEIFLIDVFGGRHRVAKLIDNEFYFVCIPHGSVSTFDDDRLTRIVLSSHRLCLRAEIDNHGMRGIKILLHNRKGRTGMFHERHPTIEEVIARTKEAWG